MYNISDKTVKTKYVDNENSQIPFIGYSDTNFIYTLEYNPENNNDFFISVYNNDYEKVKNIDFNEEVFLSSQPSEIGVFENYIYLNNFSNKSFFGEIKGNEIIAYPDSEKWKFLRYDSSLGEITFMDTNDKTIKNFDMNGNIIKKMQINIEEQIGVAYFGNKSLIFSALNEKAEVKWYQALLE